MLSASHKTCRFFALLLLIAVVGCATATDIKFTHDKPSSGSSIIYIYRIAGLWGGANAWNLKANGKPIAIVANGGYYAYRASPEEVTFSSKLRPGFGTLLTAWLDPERRLITITPEPGKTYYARFEIELSSPVLVLVDEKEAKKEMSSLNRFETLAH